MRTTYRGLPLLAALLTAVAIWFTPAIAGAATLTAQEACTTALPAKRVSSLLGIKVKLVAQKYEQSGDNGYACLYRGVKAVAGFATHKDLVQVVLLRDTRDASTTPNSEGYTPVQNGARAFTVNSLSAYGTMSQAGSGITVSTGRWWVTLYMRYPEYTDRPPYDSQTADGFANALTPQVVRSVTTSHIV